MLSYFSFWKKRRFIHLVLTTSVIVSSNLVFVLSPSPTHAQSPSTSFAYDYEGNLVWVKDTDGEHYYFGSEDVTVKQTGTVVGAVETKRFSLPITDSVRLVKDNDHLYLVSTDYLSSTRQIVRSDGTLLSTPTYHPYGQEKTDINLTTVPTDRFYTSQRKLAGTPLYHYGARLYSPTLGMFIQPDSVEGPNRYAYARNNPVMYSDPSGHVAALPNEGGSNGLTSTFPSQGISSSTVVNGTLSSAAPYESANPQGDIADLARFSVLTGGAALLVPAGVMALPAMAGGGLITGLQGVIGSIAGACSLGARYCIGATGQFIGNMLNVSNGGPESPNSALEVGISQYLGGRGLIYIDRYGSPWNYHKLLEPYIKHALGEDLTTLVNATGKPLLEVAGPTERGLAGISESALNAQYFVSNIVHDPQVNTVGKIYVGSIDLAADYTKLPIAQNSLGCLATSCMMRSTYQGFVAEANRVVTPGGYVVIQGGFEYNISGDSTIPAAFQSGGFTKIFSGVTNPDMVFAGAGLDYYIYQKR